MILDSNNINKSDKKEFLLYDFCNICNIDVEILFLFKYVNEYCDEPPCSDEYKDIFLKSTQEERMKCVIEIYNERKCCFYPYGEDLLNSIFNAFNH